MPIRISPSERYKKIRLYRMVSELLPVVYKGDIPCYNSKEYVEEEINARNLIKEYDLKSASMDYYIIHGNGHKERILAIDKTEEKDGELHIYFKDIGWY